jgi:hypothetical protein
MDADVDSSLVTEVHKKSVIGLVTSIPVVVVSGHFAAKKLATFSTDRRMQDFQTIMEQVATDVSSSVGSMTIAVRGAASRFPGQSGSPDAFYSVLRSGADCVTDVPFARWDQ